ncbi:hypothetical protein NEFER03_1076 [Nematocida sp. LUAm3]|nr:hypothetical protein NEFER03_1076 [Nematocida sp. LUAm3]KAI5175319.1 hypothetical protein NEFER02_1248 [Nematocida sp. LUAm2]KAI5177724.1 hypothetical protein NEFER01_0948 [Nematocida sp. LUAm1]
MHLTESKEVHDKELEETLVLYLDTPYFFNNPWYLSLWIRYFNRSRNSHVLFLMHMKGIGTLHYWLYKTMHEYYREKGCMSCSRRIIEEGLKVPAYPVKELEELLANEKDNKEVEKHALEKPSRIRVFDKEWIRKSSLAYDKSKLLIEGKVQSILLYKIGMYARRKQKRIEEETEKGLNEVSLLFGSGAIKDTHAEEKKEKRTQKQIDEEMAEIEDLLGDSKRRKIDNDTYSAIRDDVIANASIRVDDVIANVSIRVDDVIADTSIQVDDVIANASIQVDDVIANASIHVDDVIVNASIHVDKENTLQDEEKMFGNVEPGDKIVVSGVLYIAKKTLSDIGDISRENNQKTLLATRIASLGDGNVTLNARDYVMKIREHSWTSEEKVFLDIKESQFIVSPEQVVHYKDKIVSLFPYLELGSLEKAIVLLKKKEEFIPEVLCAHYLREILYIGQQLLSNQYSIGQCTEKDFLLLVENGKISLKLSKCSSLVKNDLLDAWESELVSAPVISFLLSSTKIIYSRDVLYPSSPQKWLERLSGYLQQKEEMQELQNHFISQEVAIYEE